MSGELWALIWWKKSKKSSVILFSEIQFTAKKEAKVLLRTKLHDVKILRTSEDKFWLESLEVDGDGKVCTPENVEHKEKLRARKRESTKENQQRTSDIKKKKLERDLKLAGQSSIFEEVDQLRSKKSDTSVKETATVKNSTVQKKNVASSSSEDETSDSDAILVSENDEEKKIKSKKSKDFEPQFSNKSKSEENKICKSESSGSKFSQRSSQCLNCPLCNLKNNESQQYIGFFQLLTEYLKNHGSSSSTMSIGGPDSLENHSPARDAPKMSWNLPGHRKVELHPMSDVYIDSGELDFMKIKCAYDPKEMTRQLFKKVIGTKTLLKMSRTGGNGWQRLPNDVFNAVHGFVSKNSRPKLSAGDFERCVTLMFTSMRPAHTKTQVKSEDNDD